jgi:hypothetical protein
MYFSQSLGEFTVRINQISIETNCEDVCITWFGISSSLKLTFEEIQHDIEVRGHIFRSSVSRYGNFNLLPYDRNSDFYINSKLKPNMVAIESYEKKSMTIDSVVTDEKFNFLIKILSTFEIKEKSLIGLKSRLMLNDEGISNSILITPSRSAFFSNGNLTGPENKYFEFGTSVDLSFSRVQKY